MFRWIVGGGRSRVRVDASVCFGIRFQKKKKKIEKVLKSERAWAYRMRCGDEFSDFVLLFIFCYISCDNQIDPVSFRVVFGNYHLLEGKFAWLLVQVVNCRITEIEEHWLLAHRPAIEDVVWYWSTIWRLGIVDTDFKRNPIEKIFVPISPPNQINLPGVIGNELFI